MVETVLLGAGRAHATGPVALAADVNADSGAWAENGPGSVDVGGGAKNADVLSAVVTPSVATPSRMARRTDGFFIKPEPSSESAREASGVEIRAPLWFGNGADAITLTMRVLGPISTRALLDRRIRVTLGSRPCWRIVGRFGNEGYSLKIATPVNAATAAAAKLRAAPSSLTSARLAPTLVSLRNHLPSPRCSAPDLFTTRSSSRQRGSEAGLPHRSAHYVTVNWSMLKARALKNKNISCTPETPLTIELGRRVVSRSQASPEFLSRCQVVFYKPL